MSLSFYKKQWLRWVWLMVIPVLLHMTQRWVWLVILHQAELWFVGKGWVWPGN